MNDMFEAWWQDERSLTYGEFLDELYGEWETWCREVAPGFLDDRWRESTEPQTPVEKAYFTVYDQCRRRLRAGQWFAVCFLDVDHHQEYTQRFRVTVEEIVEILVRIVDQIVLEPGLDGFVARVGKVRAPPEVMETGAIAIPGCAAGEVKSTAIRAVAGLETVHS